MEYLMTYGWAILIISVVLGALFSLGVFSSSSFIGTSCIPSSGYYCSISQYTHGNASIIVTVGQSGSNAWSYVALAYVPQGTASSSGIPAVANANIISLTSGIASGGEVTETFNAPSSSVGGSTAGSIWACYSSSAISNVGSATFNALTGCNYVQMATLTAKAT